MTVLVLSLEGTLAMTTKLQQPFKRELELNGEKVVGATEHGDIVAHGKIGLMAQANLGGSTLAISFNGVANQNPFVVAGSTAYGIYTGFDLNAPIAADLDLTASVGGSVRSDGVAGANASLGLVGGF